MLFKNILIIILVVNVLYGSSSGTVEKHQKRDEMKRICLIVDTTCDKYRVLDMAAHLKKALQSYQHIVTTILDIATFSLPLLYQKMPPAQATEMDDIRIKKWSKAIRKADGFIFITHEAHNAYAGSFKNALDLLYHEWNGKPAGVVVCSGTEVATELLAEQLRGVLGALQLVVIDPIVLITNKEPLLFVESLKKSFQVQAMLMTISEYTAPKWYRRFWNRIKTYVTRLGFTLVRYVSAKGSQLYYRIATGQHAHEISASLIQLRSDVTIGVVLGSTRDQRLSLPIAKTVQQVIVGNGGIAEIIDLKDYQLSLACHDTFAEGVDQSAAQLQDAFQRYDGYIFVVPEYNGGLPGVLKSALDVGGKSLFNKPVAVVGLSGGRNGGKHAYEHFVSVLHALHAILIAKPLFIATAWRFFDQNGLITPQPAIIEHIEQIAILLGNFCASCR